MVSTEASVEARKDPRRIPKKPRETSREVALIRAGCHIGWPDSILRSNIVESLSLKKQSPVLLLESSCGRARLDTPKRSHLKSLAEIANISDPLTFQLK